MASSSLQVRSSMPIPPELCDYIVDFLYDDISTLRKCSLTCRAWVPTSRIHLFEKVSLSNSKLCTAFSKTLETSPYLGHYVREISVTRLTRIGADELNGATDPKAVETLSSLLVHLPSIQIFGFYLTDVPPTPPSQSHLRLTELIIVACRFVAFDDFIDLVHSFPQLEHLHLDAITWQTQSLDLRPRPASPRLRRLTIGRDANLCLLVEWLLTGTLYDEIDSVSVRCASKPEAIAVGALLEALGPSLRDLSLDWYLPMVNVLALPPAMSVAPCTHLRNVTLHCAIPDSCSIPWINTFISELNSADIENITLQIRLLGGLDGIDWRTLEGTLGESRFSGLRTLTVDMKLWPSVVLTDDEARAEVCCRLPVLVSRDVVRFPA